jgi:hypothetical protein
MLKAFNPVVILLISFAFRLQEPNQRLIGVVAVSLGKRDAEIRDRWNHSLTTSCVPFPVADDLARMLHGSVTGSLSSARQETTSSRWLISAPSCHPHSRLW